MTDEEIEQAIGNAPVCMWTGLPPCPKCDGDHGDPACHPSDDKVKRMHHAGDRVIRYALTCRVVNQPEWMVGLIDRVNRFAELADAKCRFEFNGDGLTRIDPVS